MSQHDVQIFEIGDLTGFFTAVVHGDEPDPSTFSPLPGATVSVRGRVANVPLGPEKVVAEATTGPDGSTALAIPVAPIRRVRLVARRLAFDRPGGAGPATGETRRPLVGVTAGPPAAGRAGGPARMGGLTGHGLGDVLDRVPDIGGTVVAASSGPCFRSETVAVETLPGRIRIFTATLDPVTVTQADIDATVEAQAAALAGDIRLDHVRASIIDGGLRLVANRKRNTITVDIELEPGTGPDLDEIVDVDVTGVDVDLTRLSALCVDEDRLAREIRVGIDTGLTDAIRRMKNQLLAETGAAIVPGLTVSVLRLAFPVVAETQVGPVRIRHRAIEITPTVAIPAGLRFGS